METIATIVTILAASVGVVAYLERKINVVRIDLKTDIQRVEARLDERIQGVETRIDGRIQGIDNRIQALDNRVFALATGMKPLIEQAQRQDSAS